MRTLLIAGLGAALTVSAADNASAQRVVQRGPGATYGVPGVAPAMRATPPVVRVRPAPVVQSLPQRVVVVRPSVGQRWAMRDGRWVGGLNAPGGFAAYRRPYVGYALPRYWVQPGFAVSSWSTYGLAQPAAGYTWYRYYDDAVLVDARGSVHDHVGGIDWSVQDGPRSTDYAYDDTPVAPDYPEEYYDRAQRERRENGVGGAVAGAVGGGILGTAIAGRGDRLEGALIGAGVGAAAGYAIDKAEDRGRRAPPPRGYGAGYPVPSHGHPQPGYGGGSRWVSPDGRTTVVTGGGNAYGGGTTTTVVVQGAPVTTTTTTTEYYDDHVTYSKPVARRTYKAVRKYRPSKAICRC